MAKKKQPSWVRRSTRTTATDAADAKAAVAAVGSIPFEDLVDSPAPVMRKKAASKRPRAAASSTQKNTKKKQQTGKRGGGKKAAAAETDGEEEGEKEEEEVAVAAKQTPKRKAKTPVKKKSKTPVKQTQATPARRPSTSTRGKASPAKAAQQSPPALVAPKYPKVEHDDSVLPDASLPCAAAVQQLCASIMEAEADAVADACGDSHPAFAQAVALAADKFNKKMHTATITLMKDQSHTHANPENERLTQRRAALIKSIEHMHAESAELAHTLEKHRQAAAAAKAAYDSAARAEPVNDENAAVPDFDDSLKSSVDTLMLSGDQLKACVRKAAAGVMASHRQYDALHGVVAEVKGVTGSTNPADLVRMLASRAAGRSTTQAAQAAQDDIAAFAAATGL